MHLRIRVRGRARRARPTTSLRHERRRRRKVGGRREGKKKARKKNRKSDAMQTQINRKNIIIEREKTHSEAGGNVVEGRGWERRERERQQADGHPRQGTRGTRGEGGELGSAHARFCASVGACALSQGELLSFKRRLFKRGRTKERL